MAKHSNTFQHTYSVATSAYTARALTQDRKMISLIWKTRWMREAIFVSSRIAYAEIGVPPTIDHPKAASAKLLFTVASYVRELSEFSQGPTQGKRTIGIDAGSIHRVEVSHGLSPDNKNKSHRTDDNPSPPQEYSKYANIANVTPAIRLLHARDKRLSIMVSNQRIEHNAPTLSIPVSRKLFSTSTEMREGAQHEPTTVSDDPM